MNEYLIELFKEENTVIIPGLGALTVVNRATNELMFMSYLKHNDGTLEKYIAHKDGIEKEVAKGKVEQYVQEISNVIENGGTFNIAKIGFFSKDASGEVQFSAIENEKGNTITPTPLVTKVEEKVEEIQEFSKEEISPVIENIEQKAEEPVISKLVEKKNSVEEAVSEIKEIPIATEEPKIVPATEEEQWNDDLDLPPLNYQPERPKKAILEKTKRDKKPQRNTTVWLLLLGLLIFGGASYIGFNYSDLKEKIPFLASKKETIEVLSIEEIEEPSDIVEEEEFSEDVQDEIIEEEKTTVVEEPVAKPEVKKTEKQPKSAPIVTSTGLRVDKNLPIQIIIGSFGEEANANRLVEKLQTQGFPAEIIGVYGGLHTVSAASFNSMDEYKVNRSQLDGVGAHWVKRK
jgi:cell division septation protein DedD